MSAADAWTVADPIGCDVCGLEACEDVSHLPPELRPADVRARDESAARPPRWQPAACVIDTPSPDPIIDGIAWADAVSVVVGESTAGKTFVLLDQAAAVSAGVRWHGRDVQQGSVVHIGYEGHVGLRLRALRDVGRQRLEHVYIIRATDPLSPVIDRDRTEVPSRGELEIGRDLDEIVAHVTVGGLPPVRLVQIDTVRASLAGSEDSSEAASAYLRAVRRLMARVPGAAAILAHHAGWQDGEARRKRERGSSAFRGNVDGTLYLETGDYDRDRGEARLTLTTLKVRDGETGPPIYMVRRRVELPGMADRWGQPVTSCIIERDLRTREDRDAEHARATEAAHRDLDGRVLRAILEHPEAATSQDRLRVLLAMRKTVVADAVSRLLQRGWIVSSRRGQPYLVTDAGRAALEPQS